MPYITTIYQTTYKELGEPITVLHLLVAFVTPMRPCEVALLLL